MPAATKAGGGQIIKTNNSSYDNVLAHPIPPMRIHHPPPPQNGDGAAPNMNPAAYLKNASPQQASTYSVQMPPSASIRPSNSTSQPLVPPPPSANGGPPLENNTPKVNLNQYLKTNIQQQGHHPLSHHSNYMSNPAALNNNSQYFNNSQAGFDANKDVNTLGQMVKPVTDPQLLMPTPRGDPRADVDTVNKIAYRRALDQQVAEKEISRYNAERNSKQFEVDTMKQYPFGRRTDPSSFRDESSYGGPFTAPGDQRRQLPPYVPTTVEGSFVRPSFDKSLDNPTFNSMPRLNKDNIVEKPNSLASDMPPYDPIKYRSGFHQGYNYDPWGKPGGGAPLIDPKTGKKQTKISGQTWYDSIGLSPDDRAKVYLDKNRPLTLEEQKYEMEIEKQRKQFENDMYKSRGADVASWIQELEGQRKRSTAHLPHTNVTREKINQEAARRHPTDKTYHDELGMQQEERNRSNMLYKLKDDVAGIEHTKKWDDWWGRPGGGAPNPERRRTDLNQKLLGDDAPGKMLNPMPNDQESRLLFAKSLQSSHKNLYDNVVN